MLTKRWNIHCTPDGLLRDERVNALITFNSYAEAEAEALCPMRAAHSNARLQGMMMDFTPVAEETDEWSS